MRNEFLFPAINSGENVMRSLAEVKKTDEPNNTCHISYKDKKGRRRSNSNVPVRSTSNAVIDWFPEEGDIVIIEINGDSPVIIGEPETYTGILNRSKNTIESDVFSDNMSRETEGGYIF